MDTKKIIQGSLKIKKLKHKKLTKKQILGVLEVSGFTKLEANTAMMYSNGAPLYKASEFYNSKINKDSGIKPRQYYELSRILRYIKRIPEETIGARDRNDSEIHKFRIAKLYVFCIKSFPEKKSDEIKNLFHKMETMFEKLFGPEPITIQKYINLTMNFINSLKYKINELEKK